MGIAFWLKLRKLMPKISREERNKKKVGNNSNDTIKSIKHASRQQAYEYIERFKEVASDKVSINKETKDLSELDVNAKLKRKEKNKARKLKRKRKRTCEDLLSANFDTKTDFLSKRTKIHEEKSLVMAEVFEEELQKNGMDNNDHPEYDPDIPSNDSD